VPTLTLFQKTVVVVTVSAFFALGTEENRKTSMALCFAKMSQGRPQRWLSSMQMSMFAYYVKQ